MRVRPQRPAQRGPLPQRRPHVFGRPENAPDAPAENAPAPAVVDPEHLAERRHRASVAPEDHALYGCSCGFQFQAPVSASVRCPHCGTSQAW
ncbi:MAG: hypothetical protein QOK49_3611 [Baekduia sp.]|nr:hypothetical protein [Baekduia sp.]